MVRRVTARVSLFEKTSLRQCIRPLVESFAPGQDEFRCVSVLTSRTVVEDHLPYPSDFRPRPIVATAIVAAIGMAHLRIYVFVSLHK
jgi:hypothetical protein